MTQKKKMTWAEWERAEKQDTPKLWRDMTDAEKGALLLADHNGEKMEAWVHDDRWEAKENGHPYQGRRAYRIKPEPKKPREWWIDPARGQVVALERVDFIHVREVMGDDQ